MSKLLSNQNNTNQLSDCPSTFPDATNDKKDVEQYLTQLLSNNLSQRIYADIEQSLTDKWLAVSSLHKSIRRGEVDLALRATATLLRADPDYLFRRLPVIAYEDIAIANPVLCAQVLFATSKRVQAAFGIKQLAFSLVEQMALSVKSRTTTDIFCLLLSDPYANDYIDSCLTMPPAKWVEIAQDKELCLTQRMAAIKLISGHSVRKNQRHYVDITKPNRDALLRLVVEMKINAIEHHLIINGQSKTLGLNGALILAGEMLSNSQTSSEINHDLTNSNDHGVIYAAYDQYCRQGREIISKFVATSKPLQLFFQQNTIKHPDKMIGVMLFIIEGCIADKQLNFDGMLKLQKQVEQMELIQIGIKSSEMIRQLLNILNSELSYLHSLRQEANLGRLKFVYTDINQLNFE